MFNRHAGLAVLCLFAGISAHAHVPFLKPSQFNVENPRLHVESAFTEYPFQADFAMDSPNFALTAPDGTVTPLKASARTKAAVYLEPAIDAAGTYRVSTGVRTGPLYKAVETAGGKLYFADDMKRVSGKPTSMMYYSSADVYLAKGEPAYTPRPRNQGVEIVPLTSPNRVSVGSPLRLTVLQDGQPAPRARVIVAYDNEHYQKRRIEDLYDVENVRASNIAADENGQFSITPTHGGLLYLFVTLHKRVQPDRWESHNAALTLEAALQP